MGAGPAQILICLFFRPAHLSNIHDLVNHPYGEAGHENRKGL